MVTETANEHKREVETESRRPVESNPLFTTDRHAIQRADIHIGRRVHNGGWVADIMKSGRICSNYYFSILPSSETANKHKDNVET